MITFESFFLSGKTPIQFSLCTIIQQLQQEKDQIEEGELETSDDNLGWKLELPIRVQCSLLAQRAGILLEHSQQTISSTQYIIQKFLCQQAPSTTTTSSETNKKESEEEIFIWAPIDLAMAATLLSSKVDSNGGWRKIRDIINVFYYIWQDIRSITPRLMEYANSQYYQWRDRLLRMELLLLKELSFSLQYTPPTQTALGISIYLSLDKETTQNIINVSNDTSLTVLPLLIEDSKTLAIAVVEYCLRNSGLPMKENMNASPKWKYILRAIDPTLISLTHRILDEFYSFTSSTENITNLLRSPISVQELD